MKYSIFYLCYYHGITNLHIFHRYRNREIMRKTNSTPNQDMASNCVIIITPDKGLREGEIGQYDIE